MSEEVDQSIKKFHGSSETTVDKLILPSARRLHGALLFVDISGFTALSQKLDVDELRKHINGYFAKILDIIANFGGEVVKFAGDALLVIWQSRYDKNSQTLRTDIERASDCGVQLVQACANHRVRARVKTPAANGDPVETFELNIHAGLSIGLMLALDVGSLNRWEFFIAGEPLRDVAMAENDAKTGEFVVSAGAHKLIHPQADVKDIARSVQCGCRVTVNGCFRMPLDFATSAPVADNACTDNEVFKYLDNAFTACKQQLLTTYAAPGVESDSSAAFSRKSTDAWDRQVYSRFMGDMRTLVLRAFELHDHEANRTGNIIAQSSRWLNTDSCEEEEELRNLWRRQFAVQDATQAAQQIGLKSELRSVIVLFINTRLPNADLYLDDDFCTASLVQGSAVDLNSVAAVSAQDKRELDLFGFLPRTACEAAEDVAILKRFQACFGEIQQQMATQGGQLRQFIVDDKGTVCIGTFGLRSAANASYDKAAAALNCAQAVLTSLRALQPSLDASIGVTSGKAYCGLVGSAGRYEYSVMGPSTNLSARLMCKAKVGEVLCDMELTRQDREHQFEALDRIVAKGYNRPVKIFRPANMKAVKKKGTTRPSILKRSLIRPNAGDIGAGSVLHGRSRDAAKLTQFISTMVSTEFDSLDHMSDRLNRSLDLQDGGDARGSMATHCFDTQYGARTVIISGPHGIGKTAFIRSISDRITRLAHLDSTYNVAVFTSQSSDHTRSESFYVFRRIIRQMLEQLGQLSHVADPLKAKLLHDRSRNQENTDAVTAALRINIGLEYILATDESLRPLKPLLSWIKLLPTASLQSKQNSRAPSGLEDQIAGLSSTAKMQKTQQMLVSIIQQFSLITNKTVLLAMDDIHLADLPSLRLLDQISKNNTGIILLLSVISSADSTSQFSSSAPSSESQSVKSVSFYARTSRNLINALRSFPEACLQLNLEAIDQAAVKRIVADMVDAGTLERMELDLDGLSSTLFSISGGNPLYTYELTRAVLASVQEMDQSKSMDSVAHPTPARLVGKQYLASLSATSRIEEVILYRFDHLDNECQTVLKAAAVAAANGAMFTASLLEFVLTAEHYAVRHSDLDSRDPLEHVARHLADLLAMGEFIHTTQELEQEDGFDAAWFSAVPAFEDMKVVPLQFKISMEQLTVYALLLEDQKLALHGRVAEYLLRTNSTILTETASALDLTALAPASANGDLTDGEDDESTKGERLSDSGLLSEQAFHWHKGCRYSSAMHCYYKAAMLMDARGTYIDSFNHLSKGYEVLTAWRVAKGVIIENSNPHKKNFDDANLRFNGLMNGSGNNTTQHAKSEQPSQPGSLRDGTSKPLRQLTRDDLAFVFDNRTTELEVALQVVVKLAQATFTLLNSADYTSRLYEEALQMIQLSRPNAISEATTTASSADASNFGCISTSALYPILSGIAALYRNGKLADTADRAKECGVIALFVATAVEASDLVHRLVGQCLQCNLFFELGRVEESMQLAALVDQHYSIDFSPQLVSFYGNDRIPYTLATNLQHLVMFGRLGESLQAFDHLVDLSAQLSHLHSRAIVVFPLCCVAVILRAYDTAADIYEPFYQARQQAGGYSFFQPVFDVYRAWVNLHVDCHKFANSSDGLDVVARGDHIVEMVHELLEHVESRTYLQNSPSERSMLFTTMDEFGLGAEFVCADCCRLLAAVRQRQAANIRATSVEKADGFDKAAQSLLRHALAHVDYTLHCRDSGAKGSDFCFFFALLLRSEVHIALHHSRVGATEWNNGSSNKATSSTATDHWQLAVADLQRCQKLSIARDHAYCLPRALATEARLRLLDATNASTDATADDTEDSQQASAESQHWIASQQTVQQDGQDQCKFNHTLQELFPRLLRL